MSEQVPDKPLLASTWSELRRRKVVRTAVAYGLVAWFVLQLGEITFEPLGLPPRFLTWTILAVILLFPIVLVLAWVFDRSEGGLTIDRSGPGLHGPVRLFAVIVVVVTVVGLAWWLGDVYGDDDAPTPMATAVAAEVLPANAIAVLPFRDLSADGDQGWFGDGLAEELLDRLARIQGVRVAARTSSFALRDSEHGVAGIGRLLNVGTVLEGSVRKAGGRMRITAQLIDANSGYQLWADTYERPEQDIFDLQDEITGDIVEQLRSRIPGLIANAQTTSTGAAATGSATADLRAHELYLQGRLYWRQRTPSSLARAADLFEQAIERDPNFARAWCGLADARLLLADYGVLTSAEAVTGAEPAVVQALTLAPDLGEAWASLGLLRIAAGQLDAAEGNLLEAIRLDPNYDMAPMWLGGLYARQGKFKARAEILDRARELSPLDPAINVNLANSLLVTGNFDDARSLLLDLLAITPDSSLARRSLADVERASGRLAESLRHADLALRQDPGGPNSITAVFVALAALHRFDEAARIVHRLPASAPVRPELELLLAIQQDPTVPLPLELQVRVDRVFAADDPMHEDMRSLLQLSALSDYWNGNHERSLRALEKLTWTREGRHLNLEQVEFAQMRILLLRELGQIGDTARLLEQLQRSYAYLIDQGLAAPGMDYSLASFELLDGNVEVALAGLEQALDAGYSELWLIDADPRWQGSREDPRYRRLHARLVAHIAAERTRSESIAQY